MKVVGALFALWILFLGAPAFAQHSPTDCDWELTDDGWQYVCSDDYEVDCHWLQEEVYQLCLEDCDECAGLTGDEYSECAANRDQDEYEQCKSECGTCHDW